MPKITIWVVSTCIPDQSDPCLPNVFASETDAEAYIEKAMRDEWNTYTPEDDEGNPLPYPGNWGDAQDALMEYLGPDWGTWELSSHTIEVSADKPASSKRMPTIKELLDEALEYEADQFDGDPNLDLDVSGADLVDWFTDWRERLRASMQARTGRSMKAHAAKQLGLTAERARRPDGSISASLFISECDRADYFGMLAEAGVSVDHPFISVGHCPICGHYGNDCTGNRLDGSAPDAR